MHKSKHVEMIKLGSSLTNQYQQDQVYMSSPLLSFFPLLEAAILRSSGNILLIGALKETQQAAERIVSQVGKTRRVIPIWLEDGTSGRGKWWQAEGDEEMLGRERLLQSFPALSETDMSNDLQKALSSLISHGQHADVIVVDELSFEVRIAPLSSSPPPPLLQLTCHSSRTAPHWCTPCSARPPSASPSCGCSCTTLIASSREICSASLPAFTATASRSFTPPGPPLPSSDAL
eukprot:85508-Hanusia_phi.AAC.4